MTTIRNTPTAAAQIHQFVYQTVEVEVDALVSRLVMSTTVESANALSANACETIVATRARIHFAERFMSVLHF